MRNFTEKLAQILFLSTTIVVAGLISQRQYGVIYVETEDGRGPSAIGRSFDVSSLEGKALSKKINEQLVSEAHILRENENIGIELGQFVTETKSGRKVLACSVYDRVQLMFKGEGEASHGDMPQLLVEGPCRNSNEKIKWMKPIWIPISDVLKKPTNDGDLNYYDSEPVSLTFANLGSSWPRRWILESIQLYDKDDTSQRITVERSSIREAAPKSILMEW